MEDSGFKQRSATGGPWDGYSLQSFVLACGYGALVAFGGGGLQRQALSHVAVGKISGGGCVLSLTHLPTFGADWVVLACSLKSLPTFDSWLRL